MTRSHKYGERKYSMDEEIDFQPQNIPKYFAKTGFADVDPKKVKKEGGGKGNWGRPSCEAEDLPAYHPTNPRRRSNSSTAVQSLKSFKTKFETVEPEPVFEEHMMMEEPEDFAVEGHDGFEGLEKRSTSGSSEGTLEGSVHEEERV